MKVEMSKTETGLRSASVYAIIEGTPIALPDEAKYVCQDIRGCWFYCARRPRVKDGDWTPNKSPIQKRGSGGQLSGRALITEVGSNWSETLHSTIRLDRLPKKQINTKEKKERIYRLEAEAQAKKIVDALSTSGLSVPAFSKKNGIPAWNLYRWQKRHAHGLNSRRQYVCRTIAQRKLVLDEWARSGLTIAAFSEAREIPIDNLYRWRRQHRDKPEE